MNDKLTIQELAAYLPYNIMAEMLDYKNDYVGKQYDEIVGIHQWDKLCLYWSALTIGGSKPNIERIKPLLLPLSHLTKEIEHKGEKFVPIERLFENIHSDYEKLLKKDLYSFRLKWDTLPYWLIQKLLEWKFDIFGLLERGIAIDKTTIQ